MSIWTRISDAVSAISHGENLCDALFGKRQKPEQSVAFTIAVLALGAKMAKADGHVTRDQVTAFRSIFDIPEAEEAHAAHVFNLARQDVAGYETYAKRIADMFRQSAPVLDTLLEGLFHVAVADGSFDEAEEVFLRSVAGHFGISDERFACLKSQYVPGAEPDPFQVLGVTRDASLSEIQTAYKHQVRETHPDRLRAKGMPDEAIKLAENRLVAINTAWQEIHDMRDSA